MDGIVHLAALCAVPGLGPVSIRKLLGAFGTPEDIFRADAGALGEVENVGHKRAEAIKGFGDIGEFERVLEKLMAQGVSLLEAGSPQYPQGVRDLGDHAPLVLYMKGEIIGGDRNSVGVVGSRKSSPYGMSAAERISGDLAEMGIAVISGGAMGIDAAAHAGSLRKGGRSIAVLGSGIDVIYPPSNRGLFERIARSGAVVSEFAPGTPPLRENFPQRNKLISALSLGVLVVEAAARSGALITAEQAREQGKPVFAVPGGIFSETSEGANGLIKTSKAQAVTSADDIVEKLAPALKGVRGRARAKKEAPELSADERAIWDVLSPEPRHIDEICLDCGLPVGKALGLLLALELKGMVRHSEGKKFSVAC